MGVADVTIVGLDRRDLEKGHGFPVLWPGDLSVERYASEERGEENNDGAPA
jgi:hypothetical protein